MVRMQHKYEEVYSNYEDKLFYFVARKQLVLSLIRKKFRNKPVQVLDLGCGTGNVLNYLNRHLKGSFTGLDASSVMLKNKKDSKIKLVKGDLYRPAFKPSSFDVILCLDVIEHLKDDLGALKTIDKLLKPKGVAIILVPAFMCLWSVHDEMNNHYRRYGSCQLNHRMNLIQGSKEVFYWNAISFFPKLIARLLPRKEKKGHSDIEAFMLPEPFNTLLTWWLYVENRWVSWGLPLPFGSSLVAVVRKG